MTHFSVTKKHISQATDQEHTVISPCVLHCHFYLSPQTVEGPNFLIFHNNHFYFNLSTSRIILWSCYNDIINFFIMLAASTCYAADPCTVININN